jgi:hypothetical protein
MGSGSDKAKALERSYRQSQAGYRRGGRPGANKSEGAGQEIKGDAQQALCKARDAAKAAVNKVADEANRKL